MVVIIFVISLLCAHAAAAPPSPPRLYHQHPEQLQQVNQLEYYIDQPDVASYYNQVHQKQANAHGPAPVAARVESSDPKTEVELIPGAQSPQQPPQQTPFAPPSIPGLLPGQQVFIVHMPIPGYRPGTIGGYQPVYIVAAGSQGNAAYPNGFTNGVFLDPSGQAAISPFLGYTRPGLVQASHPGYVFGHTQLLNRPYDLPYHDQGPVYQQAAPAQGQITDQGRPDGQRSVLLSQLVALQRGQQAAALETSPRTAGNDAPSNMDPKRAGLSRESKETAEEPRRNARPNPPHAQSRKA